MVRDIAVAEQTASPLSQPLGKGEGDQGKLAMIDQIRAHLATAYNLPAAKIDHLLAACSDSLHDHLREAEAALERGDIDTVAASAHTIKGMLLNLRINELAELAHRIESDKKRREETMHYAEQLKALRYGLLPLLSHTVDHQKKKINP